MTKKDRQKKGDGASVNVFLFGKYLDKVTERQSEFLLKYKRPCSRETAILKLISGE